MNNHKIRVNNEAESREAQELFFELGYKHKWDGAVVKESWNKARFVYAEDKILWSGNCSDDFAECNFQELTLPQLRDLVAQSKSNEQGLISGADALRALADGEDVLWKADSESIADAKRFIEHPPYLALALDPNCNYQFWIKPRTIKLSLDIPVCGKNYKHGQLIWVLNSLEPNEYCSVMLDESDELPAYWWVTEDEIKIVVEQLRKIKEHSK